MFQRLFVWPLFAALMGFALGGSFVWGWNPVPVVVGSQHQHEIHSTEATKTTDAEPKGTASAPFFVQVIPSPKPAEERAQEEEDREEKKTADRWLVRWTFALFAATIGLILATGVLGFFAWGQAGDMKDSVEAAKRSADIAQQALIAGQRAFVSVSSFDRRPNRLLATKEVLAWEFAVVWGNSGNTPTRNLRGQYNIVASTSPVPADWDFPDILSQESMDWKRNNIPIGSINAKGIMPTSHRQIPVEVIQRVIEGKMRLYTWGWATYNDVFPGTRQRVTRFFAEVTVTGNARIPEQVNFDFVRSSRYDGCDEECDGSYPAEWTPRSILVTDVTRDPFEI